HARATAAGRVLDDVHTLIIGAGAVGLACAAVLARRGEPVAVLERHRRPGQETSARNSGVIHAGLYYPTGSLKARLCVAGRDRLYARCARAGVPHRRCGKIVVAIDGAEVQRRVPAVRAVGGLWSPSTGIVDAHALMDSYRHEAEAHGAMVVLD